MRRSRRGAGISWCFLLRGAAPLGTLYAYARRRRAFLLRVVVTPRARTRRERLNFLRVVVLAQLLRAFIPVQAFLQRGGECDGTSTSIGGGALARERCRSGNGRSVPCRERLSAAARGARAV